jgi:hypothetical protein
MTGRKDSAEGTFTPLSSTDEPAGSQRSAATCFFTCPWSAGVSSFIVRQPFEPLTLRTSWGYFSNSATLSRIVFGRYSSMVFT